MEFDYELFKEIIIVVIPLLIGAITAALITNRWQKQNEKSRIKRQILKEYEESVKDTFRITSNFFSSFYDYCHEKQIIQKENETEECEDVSQYSNKENKIKIKVVSEFSDEEKKELNDKFLPELEKVKNKNREILHKANSFLSSIRVYYKNDDKVIEDFRKLRSEQKQQLCNIMKLIKINDKEKFEKQIQDCSEFIGTMPTRIGNFEKFLVEEKLRF